jgi:flap endonuclease-1
MGIKDLNKFINTHVPESIQTRDLCYFRGQKMAIDTSIFMYKYLYKNENFLEGFLQQIYKLSSYNIAPIFIFDGTPPSEKKYVLDNRKQKRKNNDNKKEILKKKYLEFKRKKLNTVNILVEIKKLERKSIKITNEHINKLKDMLDLMSIKYIQADCEADTYCGALYQQGLVDACISDDMDFLTCGSNKLIRNFNISNNNVLSYNLDLILNKLDISREQWVDICILCGCDYTKKIKGINYKNAYYLINKYENIENIISNISSINLNIDDIENSYLENFDYTCCRRIFDNHKYIKIKLSKEHINIGILWGNQINEIIDLLKMNTNLSKKQLNTRLEKIYKIKI